MSEPDKTATPRRSPEGIRIGETVKGISASDTSEKSAGDFRKIQSAAIRHALEREYGARAHYERILRGSRSSVSVPPVGRDREIELLASAFGPTMSTMRSNSGLLLPADSEPGVEFEEAAEPRFSDDQDGRRDQDKNQGAPAGKREILAGVLVSSFGMMLGLIAAVIGIVHQVPLVIWLPVAGVSSSLSAISWVFLFKAWQYRKGFYARLLGVTYDLAVCADILTRDFDLTFFGEIERRAVEAVISDARLVRDQLFASGDKEEASVLGDQINDVLFSLDDAMYVAATGASD